MDLLLVAWSCAVHERRGKRGKEATLNDARMCEATAKVCCCCCLVESTGRKPRMKMARMRRGRREKEEMQQKSSNIWHCQLVRGSDISIGRAPRLPGLLSSRKVAIQQVYSKWLVGRSQHRERTAAAKNGENGERAAGIHLSEVRSSKEVVVASTAKFGSWDPDPASSSSLEPCVWILCLSGLFRSSRRSHVKSVRDGSCPLMSCYLSAQAEMLWECGEPKKSVLIGKFSRL